MTLLWAARRGLSEAELLEIMKVPPVMWSPFYLAMKESLVTRSGLLGFFHDFLRKAVHARYIDTPDVEKAAHLRLAAYFDARELDVRKVDELPWQLAKAVDWEGLRNCLADLSFFEAAYNNNEYEVLAFWQRLEDNSTFRCAP